MEKVAKDGEPVKAPQPLSVTQLQMYQRCGVQYEFRYIQGVKAPPGIALIRGRAVHAANERNYRQKIKSRSDLPVDEVTDAAAQAVDEGFAGELALTEKEETVGISRLRDQTKDTAVGLSRLYRTELAPTIQPVLVEEKITLRPDPAAFPRPLVGVIDLKGEDGILRDTKTASKTPPEGNADQSQQITMYSILDRARSGKPAAGFAIDTLIETSGGKRSLHTELTQRGPEDEQRLVRRLGTAVRGIEAGVFIPTNPENWWCSKNWCGYFNICPFVKK